MARVVFCPPEKQCRKYIQDLESKFNNWWIPKIMDRSETLVYIFYSHDVLSNLGLKLKV